jgi:two-component system, chemotaxis family, sensor kinase CheA
MSDQTSILMKIVRGIVLPREMSAFEAGYLRRMNRIGLVFFALHVPVMMVLGWLNGTGPWLALALTSAVVAGPALAYLTIDNPRTVSVTYGVAAMFVGGVLVHFGQGPVQIEMHFYFFALIAMLAVFGNPMVILAAAVTVALHHLVLWFVLPASVFNYDAPVWVVAVHAAFVVLESVAACFIARSFFDNVIGLEKIVAARTTALDQRNREMRLMLDNVAQGFGTMDRDGRLSPERSRPLDRWFGDAVENDTLFDLVERRAPEFADVSRMSWEQVTDGFLPSDLAIAQMPRELTLDDSHFRFAYVPIGDADAADRYLVVVTDVTAQVKEERAECERREAMVLFERLLADRSAVEDFFFEAATLVDSVTSGRETSLVVVQRMLHTLKGNGAIFGLRSLSDVCHELESFIAEEGTLPPASELARLEERWATLAHSVERWLGVRRRKIEIDAAQHGALEQAIRQGVARPELAMMVHDLKLEATERRLEHFGEQVRRIAARLEKDVAVQVEGNGLRIDGRQWTGFWSAFIHAVRNAVDHGVESPTVRAESGKPQRGSVTLRTHAQDKRFVVEIADDGAGVDWSKVAVKARDRGLPYRTDAELRNALFCDGVSTAARVTDISGRGLGMGALQEATRALGGDVEIETTKGRGTTFRMVFPESSMAPGRNAAVLSTNVPRMEQVQ